MVRKIQYNIFINQHNFNVQSWCTGSDNGFLKLRNEQAWKSVNAPGTLSVTAREMASTSLWRNYSWKKLQYPLASFPCRLVVENEVMLASRQERKGWLTFPVLSFKSWTRHASVVEPETYIDGCDLDQQVDGQQCHSFSCSIHWHLMIFIWWVGFSV